MALSGIDYLPMLSPEFSDFFRQFLHRKAVVPRALALILMGDWCSGGNAHTKSVEISSKAMNRKPLSEKRTGNLVSLYKDIIDFFLVRGSLFIDKVPLMGDKSKLPIVPADL